jgi:hypothetical protein
MSIDAAADLIEQLGREADEKLGATEPTEWGEEIDLAEGEKFFGRYLGEEISPETNRGVLLTLARTEEDGWNGPPCFIRIRTMLQSELDRARPSRGDYLVVARGEDREGKENVYFTFAVAAAPCPDPLPGQPAAGGAAGDNGIPFAPTVV